MSWSRNDVHPCEATTRTRRSAEDTCSSCTDYQAIRFVSTLLLLTCRSPLSRCLLSASRFRACVALAPSAAALVRFCALLAGPRGSCTAMASAGTALLAPSPARSSPISALSSSTSLVVTIRHLPSDRWLTFSAPKEWRIGQLKDAALVAFGESPPSQPPRRSLPLREPVVDAFRTPRAGRRREGIVGEELAKENEVPDDRATKRRSSGGGGLRSVGRVASAMASKVRTPSSSQS